MNEARINELMENENFIARAKEITSVEEAIEFLGTYGVEASEEDLFGFDSVSESELYEDVLDNVSGGGILKSLWNWLFNRSKKSVDNYMERMRKLGY